MDFPAMSVQPPRRRIQPNQGILGSMLRQHVRTNDRMDKEEVERATEQVHTFWCLIAVIMLFPQRLFKCSPSIFPPRQSLMTLLGFMIGACSCDELILVLTVQRA